METSSAKETFGSIIPSDRKIEDWLLEEQVGREIERKSPERCRAIKDLNDRESGSVELVINTRLVGAAAALQEFALYELAFHGT